MDFNLSEEQNMLLETIRSMGKKEDFKDLAKQVDATGEFPFHLLDLFAGVGLLGMTLPSEYGGGDQPSINAILCIEELARFSPMIAAPVFESNVGPARVIAFFGTEEQKKRILPGVCSGEYSVSVCMTEQEAGSDLTALSTNAVEKGDCYILNGSKSFVTGGGHASHYMVYTRFDHIRGHRGIGALIVEKGMDGFTFGKQETFMGLRGMPSCDLFFDDVEVPKSNLVLPAGGFTNLMMTFDIERCGNAAMCLGVAGGALEEAVAYAQERKTFGKEICHRQAIQFMIVDMATKLDAAKLLVYRAINGAGRGLPSIYEASMAKAFANEMVVEVTNLAMQIFGGYGYSTELPLERMCRDARGWGVAGGTIEMLKIGLAGMIFKQRFSQR